ncbi:hypothetical protein CMV_014165 [Castanea mollissima]|uniref:Uncharacterized protein n=1 Tax=Castanea mollissima TaxID=60419 RepID=A0A8J4RCI3_9ROSI|nr:hypothetical protein CMV_014165 [Castanea mollissima]
MYHLLRFASANSHNVPVNIVMGLPKGSARNGAELYDLETKHQVLSMLAGNLKPQKKADGYERPRSLIKLYEKRDTHQDGRRLIVKCPLSKIFCIFSHSACIIQHLASAVGTFAVIEIDVLQLLTKNDKGYSHCVQIWSWFNYCNRICIVIIPIRLLFWVCSNGEAVSECNQY